MAKSNGFDLSQFDTISAAESGSIMYVLHPKTFEQLIGSDGEKVWIKLAGTDSSIFRRAKHRRNNRRLHSIRGSKITSEKMDSEDLELLAECTLEWSMNFVDGGEALECNKQNAIKLYTRYPWLFDQANEFVGDRANFLQS